MRIVILAISTAMAAFTLSGCATVVNGTHQDLVLTTIPDGSTMTVTGGESCTSPCKIKLKRRNPVRVDIAHAGFKPTYVLVRSKAGGATVGNVLAGGLIGIVVDSSNGSNNFLSPNPVKVKLAPEGSAEESKLLDKNDKEQLVSAYNATVRADVAPTIGAEAAGVVPPAQAATPAPAPVAASATGPAASDPAPAAPAAESASATPAAR
jgi:hypothetical protein